jgi:hypothetical protein
MKYKLVSRNIQMIILGKKFFNLKKNIDKLKKKKFKFKILYLFSFFVFNKLISKSYFSLNLV